MLQEGVLHKAVLSGWLREFYALYHWRPAFVSPIGLGNKRPQRKDLLLDSLEDCLLIWLHLTKGHIVAQVA